MDRKKLGRRIREERLRIGMTQEQVAAHIDVSTTYMGYIERGERSVTLEKLVLLAECFHVQLDTFMKEKNEAAASQNKEDQLQQLWELTPADEKDTILSFMEFIVNRKE